jgi:hypothetical protein
MQKNTAPLLALRKWFHRIFWPLTILLITLFIVLANYVPGKWLTGWDTLHPEFNFPLHISRSIFGVWRQDQGLGTVAAHSHMSELPRILVLWVMSLALPSYALRAGLIYLCFILGPLGIYYFIRNGVFKEKKGFIINAAAFLGALVYIFNLGTAQHFYVIFEMFAVQYAALGWLFLFVLRCLYSKDKRNYFIFFIISFLSASMAYASQLWFAYFGALILFLSVIVLQERKKHFIKQGLLIIGLTLAANSFWLLPNFYFLLTDAAKVPASSHINQLFSEESFLHNANFGKIKDVTIFRNFLFNWLDLKKDGKFGDLLPQWKEHINHIWIISIGYVTFILSLFGLALGFLKKKKILIALFPVLLLALFMLMNMNPPFNYFFGWLRDNVSLFKEGLRTPFTKFSLLLMFSVSVYFATFFYEVMHFFKKLGKVSTFINILIVILVSLCLGFYGLPLLQGQLIEKKLLNTIPQPYFSLYSWLDKQSEQARIINLPLQTSAGWEFYDWGYEGAGFIWFGMKQPIAVRDFDRWSPYNEGLYKELSSALYGNDPQSFQNTLKKYDVSFLLLDESIVNPNKPADPIKKPEIKAMLAQLGLQPAWQQEFLSIYDARSITGNKQFVYSPKSFTKVNAETTYNERDYIYQQNGSYVSAIPNDSSSSTQFYPFSSYLKDQISGVEYSQNMVTLRKSLPSLKGDYQLVIPPVAQGKHYTTQATISFSDDQVKAEFSNQTNIQIGENNITLPQLPLISLKTPRRFQSVIIEVGDRQVEIENGHSKQIELTFEIGQPISLSVFNVDNIKEEKGQKFIDPRDVFSASLPSIVWTELTKEKKIDANSAKDISIQVNSIPYRSDISDLNTATSCDPARKNGWIKKLVSTEGITYKSADLAVVCDGTGLFNLNQSGSYLMRWQVKNTSGRGIKLYLQNQSAGRPDLEELIPNKTTDVSYAMLSWPHLKDEGYYLSWENRSFGSEVSENMIKSIEIYPVPLDLISQIRIEPKDFHSRFENEVQLSNVWKFGTYQYGLQANVESDHGIVVLSQGFEKGWVAFDLSKPIPTLLHKVKYNGWANAWELAQGKHDVIIVFWPQLLEFVGLTFLLIGFSITLRVWVKAHSQYTRKRELFDGKPLKIARNTLKGRHSI